MSELQDTTALGRSECVSAIRPSSESSPVVDSAVGTVGPLTQRTPLADRSVRQRERSAGFAIDRRMSRRYVPVPW